MESKPEETSQPGHSGCWCLVCKGCWFLLCLTLFLLALSEIILCLKTPFMGYSRRKGQLGSSVSKLWKTPGPTTLVVDLNSLVAVTGSTVGLCRPSSETGKRDPKFTNSGYHHMPTYVAWGSVSSRGLNEFSLHPCC